MLSQLASAIAVTATLVAPMAALSTDGVTATTDSVSAKNVVTTIPLVRESLGVWYTLPVNQTCPDSHPYVHVDRWVGTLPENVTFLAAIGDEAGSPAVRLSGPMTNWNFSVKAVSIDLKCTSDPDLAAQVPDDRGI